MPEITHTFRRVERSNERANASLQPFDRALRSLAQQCLQGMEHQLYWVELRRILRQVAQFCAASLDRLLHAGDFVEGDVVDDHNVLALERGGQTLLDISQEGFSVHGSLDQHRRHDTGLTEASDERHRFPVPHRHIPDQALSARVPTVGTHHVGGDCSFVDKYKVGGVKQALLADPASARPSHVGSLALCPPADFFLTVMPWRAKNRESALRLPAIRRLCSAKTISSSVKSGCSLMRARIRCVCFSNGEVLPPRDIGSEVPSSRK